jgi:catechol 2,3-dioxygenase-like lactoylglutathione lyase family enzyme
MKAGDPMQVVVRYLIALLCVAALLAIVAIASGSELDETSSKVVGTAAALAFFSLAGVAGANLARRRPEIALFGYATALLSATAFVLVSAAIWEWGDGNWNASGIAIVLAVAAGHASLLLSSARDEDGEGVRTMRAVLLLVIALLSLMAAVEISADGEDISPQAFGIVAVLYILGTLLLPLVRRLSADREVREADRPDRPRPDAAGQAVGGPHVVGIEEVAVALDANPRTDSFFREVLGGQRISGPDGASAYRLGEQQLKVYAPGDSRVRFVWSGAIEAAVEHLRLRGVESIEGPVDRLGTRGPGRSVFFRDPDGDLVELISYD